MVAVKKKNKTKSPLSISQKLNKKQLGIIVAAFAVLGVGAFYWYKTHAYSALDTVSFSPSGYAVKCVNTALDSGFGPLGYNCIARSTNINTDSTYYLGIYSPITGKFNKSQQANLSAGRVSYASGTCGNMKATFYGLGPVWSGGFGNLWYGYVYKGLTAAPGIYSFGTKGCSLQDNTFKPILNLYSINAQGA